MKAEEDIRDATSAIVDVFEDLFGNCHDDPYTYGELTRSVTSILSELVRE